MLVQPIHVVIGGASGHYPNSSEVPALPAELAILRDGLAAGEVTTAEAVSSLTSILTALSEHPTDTSTFTLRRSAFPRWTFGGYCTMCFVYGCQNPRCEAAASRYTWAVCPDCKGSTYKDIDQNPNGDVTEPCDCFFGAVEVEPASPIGWRPAQPSQPMGPEASTDAAQVGQCPNPDDRYCGCELCTALQVYEWPVTSDGRFIGSLSRSGL